MSTNDTAALMATIRSLEERVAQLERAEVAPAAAATPAPTARGDMLAASSVPDWALLPLGAANYMLMVNVGGTDPVWVPADWDAWAAGASSDLVHDHQSAGGGGLLNVAALVDHTKAVHDALGLDHGALSGRSDDDHTQYYNAARHTAAVHDALGLHHGDLAGLGDNDHTIYARKASSETISGVWTYSTAAVFAHNVLLRGDYAYYFQNAAGTANRAYLHHNGTDLYIRSFVLGGRILFQGYNSSGVNRALLYCDPDGGAELYHGNTGKKLEAVAAGVQITGLIDTSTPPFALAYRNSNQSIPNGAWTAINFNVQALDTDTIFAPTSTQLKPVRSGYYQFGGCATFAVNASNQRGIAIRKNGGSPWMGMVFTTSIPTYSPQLSTSFAIWMNGTTDYVEIMVYQNSGAALNLFAVSAAHYANAGWCHRIA